MHFGSKNRVIAAWSAHKSTQKIRKIKFRLVERTFVAGREGSSEHPEPPLGTGLVCSFNVSGLNLAFHEFAEVMRRFLGNWNIVLTYHDILLIMLLMQKQCFPWQRGEGEGERGTRKQRFTHWASSGLTRPEETQYLLSPLSALPFTHLSRITLFWHDCLVIRNINTNNIQIENLFLSGPFHLIKLLSFFSIWQMWTDSQIRWKKHSAAPPGIEPGSSDCRSDALTTELRSHDRNCVRIFVLHQAVSSFQKKKKKKKKKKKRTDSLVKDKIRTQFCRGFIAQWLERPTGNRKTQVRSPAELRCVFSSDPAVSSHLSDRKKKKRSLTNNEAARRNVRQKRPISVTNNIILTF